MNEKTDLKEIYENFRTVGDAIRRVNGNNTHSGNLSAVDPDDPGRFYTTASGSQIGALVPRDIVPIRYKEVSWGDGRASTESNIHRKILSLPGANACIHCHHILSTVMSFDNRDRRLFLKYLGDDPQGNQEFIFQPVDIHGSSLIGGVMAGAYKQPVGSIEMETRIPRYLAETPITLVKGHGPFTRGTSLRDCLRHLSVFESSATLALNLARRGIELKPIQNKIMEQGPESIFPGYPFKIVDPATTENQVEDESTIHEFSHWAAYIYDMTIGAFGTGSMSRKITAGEMIFCPMSAIPSGMDLPLIRTSTKIKDQDDFELMLHKLIYTDTNFTTCIMASNPLATAEGMAILAHRFGMEALLGESPDIPYDREAHPVVAPIDAEAIYLNPRLGLVDSSHLGDRSSGNPVLNMLRWHKGCCVVGGFGVIATGDT
ncbi:MAG: class II aldolase/adducin family protein, partial [Acidobacteria bacterium]|nr:class II aldolase/adducin family protein [Acidobacteriota bacterium]